MMKQSARVGCKHLENHPPRVVFPRAREKLPHRLPSCEISEIFPKKSKGR